MDTPWNMKAYGYPHDDTSDKPVSLQEVTFVADAVTIRKFALLLNRTAELMDEHGSDFGHEHFSDFIGGIGARGDCEQVGPLSCSPIRSFATAARGKDNALVRFVFNAVTRNERSSRACAVY